MGILANRFLASVEDYRKGSYLPEGPHGSPTAINGFSRLTTS